MTRKHEQSWHRLYSLVRRISRAGRASSPLQRQDLDGVALASKRWSIRNAVDWRFFGKSCRLFALAAEFWLFWVRTVEAHNVRLSSLLNASASRETSWLGIQRLVEPSEGVSSMTQPSQSQTIVQLLHAAEEKSGRLSVTQGVMATGLGFSTIEALLQGMVRTGYVEIGNDPETGVVVYEFKEL